MEIVTAQVSPSIAYPVGASMPTSFMQSTMGPESLWGQPDASIMPVTATAPRDGVVAGQQTSQPQTDWFSGLTSMVSPLLSLYQQKKLTDINAQRAAQGLPPIDAAGAGLAAQAQVGLDEGTKKILMYGIGAATLVGLAIAFRPRAR